MEPIIRSKVLKVFIFIREQFSKPVVKCIEWKKFSWLSGSSLDSTISIGMDGGCVHTDIIL